MNAARDGLGVKIHYYKVSCCPEHDACPECGKRGKRKQRLQRQVRSIAYGKIVYLDVEYAEYRARCDCCKTFRSTPPGVELGCYYDNQVRQAVLDRLIEDGLSVQKLMAALQRDFLLDLSEGFIYLPALATLRTFMDKVDDLFSADQTRQQAGCRRSALVRSPAFQAIPELAQTIEMLSPEKFEKMMAFLHSEAGQQVRTNNHVERAHRKLRYFEKVRYKWRRRRSIVRFLLLSLQHWRNEHPNGLLRATSRNPANKVKPSANDTYALSG